VHGGAPVPVFAPELLVVPLLPLAVLLDAVPVPGVAEHGALFVPVLSFVPMPVVPVVPVALGF